MKPSYEAHVGRLIEQHLVPFFGAQDLREIGEDDVLRYIRAKLESGLAPSTIRNALAALQRVMTLAHRDGRITRNPVTRIGELMRRVDRRAATEVQQADAWTREEVETLLAVAGEHEARFAPLLHFLFATDCRRGEALGLKWEDVAFRVVVSRSACDLLGQPHDA